MKKKKFMKIGKDDNYNVLGLEKPTKDRTT